MTADTSPAPGPHPAAPAGADEGTVMAMTDPPRMAYDLAADLCADCEAQLKAARPQDAEAVRRRLAALRDLRQRCADRDVPREGRHDA